MAHLRNRMHRMGKIGFRKAFHRYLGEKLKHFEGMELNKETIEKMKQESHLAMLELFTPDDVKKHRELVGFSADVDPQTGKIKQVIITDREEESK